LYFQAVYDKTQLPNIIVGPPRLLSDSMATFHQSQEEVTLQVTQSEFIVTNGLSQTFKKCARRHVLSYGSSFFPFTVRSSRP
jgi:hypothetical protein